MEFIPRFSASPNIFYRSQKTKKNYGRHPVGERFWPDFSFYNPANMVDLVSVSYPSPDSKSSGHFSSSYSEQDKGR
jgi:hypothetical protein